MSEANEHMIQLRTNLTLIVAVYSALTPERAAFAPWHHVFADAVQAAHGLARAIDWTTDAEAARSEFLDRDVLLGVIEAVEFLGELFNVPTALDLISALRSGADTVFPVLDEAAMGALMNAPNGEFPPITTEAV